MAIGRRQEPVSLNPDDSVTPSPGEARLPLDVPDRLLDGLHVRGGQGCGHRRVCDGEQNTCALRSREREVERRDLCAPVLGLEPLPG